MLLCNAGYYGTLAAIRSLGRSGVAVTTVDPAMLATGRYSRYTSSHLSCPPFEHTNQFAQWLLRLGKTGPRRVIYATSDAVSLALAAHRDELSEYFDLYQPDLPSTMRILDKGQLLEHSRAVGIDTPDTWLPTSRQEAERIIRQVGGTILVKPRSQLSVRTYTKGAVSGAGQEAVLARYDGIIGLGAHDPEFAKRFPEVVLPMLQRYHPEAMEAVYSLSGFRDITGKQITMLGARKVLQHPRRLGVGLCFEEAEVVPEIAVRAALLCERIGYYGAFELEYIMSGGRALLIDFNGRFYNQMAFDIKRGLDLPGLVHAAAVGDNSRVETLVSNVAAHATNIAFCNEFGLTVMICMQRMTGAMSKQDAVRWQDWRRAPGRKVVDAVRDPYDRLPATIDAMQQIYMGIRHPRSFYRQFGFVS